MPSVLSKDEWPVMVVNIVEKGIMDDSVEVRVKAAQVLAGLLHCAFISKEGRDNILVSVKILLYIKNLSNYKIRKFNSIHLTLLHL